MALAFRLGTGVDYDSHADESSTKKDALPLFNHCNFCRFDT